MSDELKTKINTDKFWRDGFLVMRDFFDPKYVLELRKQLIQSENKRKEQNRPHTDLLADPYLEKVVYNAAMVAAAKQILGKQPVYFGDANYSIVNEDYQEYRDIGGYHRDNADRSDPNGPDWRSPYTIIRFGIYLQDHHKYSGGILMIRESHNKFEQGRLERLMSHRYLDTRVGDLAVWSMRTYHAGVGRFVRGFPQLPITQRGQKFVPAFLHAPKSPEQRAAIFITYALEDTHLERYLKYLRSRSQYIDIWKNSAYGEDTIARCSAAGLKVLPMREQILEEIRGGAQLGQNLHHRAIPY